MENYEDLQPKEVFKWFRKISDIPRCSGNEKEVSDFLVDFARERDLQVVQDEEFNVIIKKSATLGYEDSPGVIIQGHMDMVCEKTSDSNHDFEKDPIQWEVEGDYLYAVDTSLGGDNGIAVAYGLALLDDDSIEHPDLEVLITTNEETGMDGANAIKAKDLDGDILLNLDAEVEGVFLASCSGGANSFVSFEKEFTDYEGHILDLDISGLLGGHSGMEIHKQRGNSIKILGRLLYGIGREMDYKIIDLQAGSKHNAIPNKGSVKVWVEDLDKAKEILNQNIDDIKKELIISDKDLEINYKTGNDKGRSYTEELSERLTRFMMIVPDGVRTMSLEIEGLVESSCNEGVILNDEDNITFMASVRSNISSLRDHQLREIEIIADLLDAKSWVEKEHPAWEFEADSPVRDLALEVYADLFNEKAEIGAEHCSLETGLLNVIKPGMDILSYGPDLIDVHSVNEHLSIKSAERVWEFTKALLKEIK
ncbi:MAG TPA: aminoacyl-histidine dipeptidase [Tissierellaceae bacterium]|nr:aminoacyl-histidine dipeptidase [Tissierellaceae bacterium]